MNEFIYIEGFTGELAMPDRQQLDDAVLEMLGISNAQERRELRRQLYTEITVLYRAMRQAELEMQRLRRENPRPKTLTPAAIARELWSECDFAVEPTLEQIQELVASRTANASLQKKIALQLQRLWRAHNLDQTP